MSRKDPPKLDPPAQQPPQPPQPKQPQQPSQAQDTDASARSSPSGQPSMREAALERVTTLGRSWWATVSRLARRHPRRARAFALGAVVVGILALIIGLRSPSTSGPQQTSPDTRLFSVSSRPALEFDHFIGRVHLSTGPDGQVSIKENKNGETDQIAINYAQRGDTIAVTADIPGGLMTDTWVDFDVGVPAHSGFNVTVATGTLEATGLGGQIALSNTNGAIWATDLTGSISLKTQSGSINLTNVSGQVSAVTQNGTITTTATHLDGHSTIQADSGSINFHGTLSRTGHYLFRNSNGAVNLTLPAGSAFALSANTTGGSINSDFAGMTTGHPSGGSEAHGAIGSAPRGQLTIQTGSGSIGIYQGG